MYQGLSYEIAAVMPTTTASGLLVSTCDIQQPSGTFSASGAPDGLFVAVDGLQGIRCTAPPKGGNDEKRSMSEIEAFNRLHVLLEGYYPTIHPYMRAVVDDTNYDIVGVESDSQGQMTRLWVQEVTI